MIATLRDASLILVCINATIWAGHSLADPVSPAQQSRCEIQANQFKAQHPQADPMDYLKNGFGYFGDAVPPETIQTYLDADSGISFSVESDGRHLVATDTNGKRIWVRNPFVDSNLCPYRTAHPYISWVGAPGAGFGAHFLTPFTPTPDKKANASIVKELDQEIHLGRKAERPRENDRFIGLTFNSSQMGYVNIRNGYFYWLGQN